MIKIIEDYARAITKNIEYFGPVENQLEQIKKIRDTGIAFSNSLEMDAVEFGELYEKISAMVCACDLCLKTYNCDNGELSRAEQAILNSFKTCSPWIQSQ